MLNTLTPAMFFLYLLSLSTAELSIHSIKCFLVTFFLLSAFLSFCHLKYCISSLARLYSPTCLLLSLSWLSVPLSISLPPLCFSVWLFFSFFHYSSAGFPSPCMMCGSCLSPLKHQSYRIGGLVMSHQIVLDSWQPHNFFSMSGKLILKNAKT